MTTIKLPEGLRLLRRAARLRPDARALDPGRGRELAARLFDPGAPRRIRRHGRSDAMLLLLGGFLLLMLLGLPVALSMAVVVAGLHSRHRHHARRDAGAAHDRRRRELSAAGRAVLHPGRQSDEHRRRHRPHLQLRGRAGGLDARRPRPRQHHRLGDLLRHVRHRDRRCRRPRHHRDQGDEGPRLLHRVRRRRHGGVRHARSDHSAVAAVRDLRHDGERLDRRAVSRRRHPRRRHDPGDDGHRRLFRAQERLGKRHAILLAATRLGGARNRHRPGVPAGGLAHGRRRDVGEHGGRYRRSWRCWRSTGTSISRP